MRTQRLASRAPTRENRLPRHIGVRRRGAPQAGRLAPPAACWSSPRPTDAKGRGRRMQPPPVAVVAAELDIELLQTSRSQRRGVAGADPGAAARGRDRLRLWPADPRAAALGLAELFNVHPSLLPRWRGAAPIERAIMAGDTDTGVCVMRLTAGLDSGPVALREEVALGPRTMIRDARAKLAALGGELLVGRSTCSPPGLEFIEQDEAQRPTRRRSPPRAPSRPGRRRGGAGRERAGADPARRRLSGVERGERLACAGRAPSTSGSRRARSGRVGGAFARLLSTARCGWRWSSRRVASRCRPTPTCAATRCRSWVSRRARRRRPAGGSPSRSSASLRARAHTELAFRAGAERRGWRGASGRRPSA